MDISEILEELERLAASWRKFLASQGDTGGGSYRGGVDVCAGQLERTIARIREETAGG